MGITADLALFRAKLNTAVDYTMKSIVAASVVNVTQQAIQTEVYDAYSPKVYDRRGMNGGLIDFTGNWDEQYDAATKTLTVRNVNRDDETGRLVAPVVESGKGYRYKVHIGPRPFHSVAEKNMIKDGVFEDALENGLTLKGFHVRKI